MFQFYGSPQFEHDLANLTQPTQKLIKAKLSYFTRIENPLLLAKKLSGHNNLFRFRVGNYRIIFFLEGQEITYVRIGHRKDVYRHLEMNDL